MTEQELDERAREISALVDNANADRCNETEGNRRLMRRHLNCSGTLIAASLKNYIFNPKR